MVGYFCDYIKMLLNRLHRDLISMVKECHHFQCYQFTHRYREGFSISMVYCMIFIQYVWFTTQRK